MENSYIYMADSFDGPYEEQPWSKFDLPDGRRFYIGKQIKAFDGKDYFLAGINYAAIGKPYSIRYGKDGRVSLVAGE